MENRKKLPNFVDLDLLVFRIGELSRMTGISSRQLRYWEQRGYISAMDREDEHKARLYNFHTLIQVLIISRLLDEGYRLPSAVEKMHDMVKKMSITREFFTRAFQGIEVDGDTVKMNLGYFDEAQTQTLYGLNEDGHIRYEVEPAHPED